MVRSGWSVVGVEPDGDGLGGPPGEPDVVAVRGALGDLEVLLAQVHLGVGGGGLDGLPVVVVADPDTGEFVLSAQVY